MHLGHREGDGRAVTDRAIQEFAWAVTDSNAVGPSGLEPETRGLTIPLRLSPPPKRAFVGWTVPSPWRTCALGASRPVSTPSEVTLGLARDRHPRPRPGEGFPDFEWCHPRRFQRGAPIQLKSAALPIELEALAVEMLPVDAVLQLRAGCCRSVAGSGRSRRTHPQWQPRRAPRSRVGRPVTTARHDVG